MGEAGRFAPGLPAKGDGQMLFMLNGVAKLKEEGRMAIIQNGSPRLKGMLAAVKVKYEAICWNMTGWRRLSSYLTTCFIIRVLLPIFG